MTEAVNEFNLNDSFDFDFDNLNLVRKSEQETYRRKRNSQA